MPVLTPCATGHDDTPAGPPAATVQTRRILITGSRAWPWPALIARVLEAERARLAADATLVIVHGACPQGADAAAAAWCAHAADRTGARVLGEAHPARWRDAAGRLDRGAGMARNAAMIAAGADLVIAFWADHSPGTADTLRRAAAARIPALVHIAYTSATPQPAPAAPNSPRPARRRTTRTRAAQDADAQAEQVMSQGYDDARNPLCRTCQVQKSITGQCLCT